MTNNKKHKMKFSSLKNWLFNDDKKSIIEIKNEACEHLCLNELINIADFKFFFDDIEEIYTTGIATISYDKKNNYSAKLAEMKSSNEDIYYIASFFLDETGKKNNPKQIVAIRKNARITQLNYIWDSWDNNTTIFVIEKNAIKNIDANKLISVISAENQSKKKLITYNDKGNKLATMQFHRTIVNKNDVKNLSVEVEIENNNQQSKNKFNFFDCDGTTNPMQFLNKSYFEMNNLNKERTLS